MSNYFTFVGSLKDYLFLNCTVRSVEGFVAVCLVVALVSSLHQWIKQLESQLQGHLNISNFSTNVASIRFFQWSKCIWLLICTVLYVVQIIFDYFLMLSVMTYNFYLLLAVIIGSAIGYFVFVKTKKSNTTIYKVFDDSISGDIASPSPSCEESRVDW